MTCLRSAGVFPLHAGYCASYSREGFIKLASASADRIATTLISSYSLIKKLLMCRKTHWHTFFFPFLAQALVPQSAQIYLPCAHTHKIIHARTCLEMSVLMSFVKCHGTKIAEKHKEGLRLTTPISLPRLS